MSEIYGRHSIEGERTVSPVAGRRWWTRNRILGAGAIGLVVLSVLAVWKVPITKPDKLAEPEKINTTKFALQKPYTPPPNDPPPPPARTAAPVMTTPVTTSQAITKAASTEGTKLPLFYSYNVPPLPEQFKSKGKGSGGGTGTHNEGETNTTHIAFKNSTIPGLKAGSMGDMTLRLPPGIIVCTMASVVESTVEGRFLCTINQDIKSPMGVTLVDSGSYIKGVYDTRVQTGQKRLRANTTELWDIKGNCVVPLGGPMSDKLGRGGLDGDYDPHTWEKLGAAGIAMLTENAFSLLQAAIQSQNQHGGNSYFQLNTGSMSSLATELLHQNSQIPPTITTHQGSQAGFWIDTVTDFSDCYGLAMVNHR